MLDLHGIATFLLDYAAECDNAGVVPLAVRDLAELLTMVAEDCYESFD